jgi:hypothetical protein
MELCVCMYWRADSDEKNFVRHLLRTVVNRRIIKAAAKIEDAPRWEDFSSVMLKIFKWL